MENTKILVILCMLCSSLVGCSGISADMVQSECLKVPTSEFTDTLKSTINMVRQVTYAVSNFTNFTNDIRLSNAVNDCLELLGLSSYNLEHTLADSQGKSNNAAKLSSDLRTWLSAALTNQETCLEGFEGTDGMIKNMVGESLNQVSSSVLDILRMVRPVPVSEGGGDEFPAWLTKKDQKLLQATGFQPNAVVSLDGTGNFTSINDAIASVPDWSENRYTIFVKRGIYKEYVEIGESKRGVTLIGEGVGSTVITGSRSVSPGLTTYYTATFARDLTFQNTAGPLKNQSVAFRSNSVVFRCAFDSFQDTLYAYTGRQFYHECVITGTVDFLFGDAAAVFQNCTIIARKGRLGQKNTVTAQGRTNTGRKTGFSIQFSNISAETETYLGRPWKPYSTTVIMQSYIGGNVNPSGWLEWNSSSPVDLLYYAEYQNHGPGVEERVKWPGYHVINDSAVANNFTMAQFIDGNSWLRATGVKYSPGSSPTDVS